MADPKYQTKYTNLQETVEHLKKCQYATADGFEIGITRAAQKLLTLSLAIVPTDTGHLASTGKVIESGKGFSKIAKVIYSAGYSIWVHERLDLAHGAAYNRKYAVEIASGRKRMRRPQEQAKFLETPLRRFKKELIDEVRQAMKLALKKEKKSGSRQPRRR